MTRCDLQLGVTSVFVSIVLLAGPWRGIIGTEARCFKDLAVRHLSGNAEGSRNPWVIKFHRSRSPDLPLPHGLALPRPWSETMVSDPL